MPLVSVIVLNYNSPRLIDVCLRTLATQVGVDYEVVVVDNGSDRAVVDELEVHRTEGRITTLVSEPVNHMFSEGNNIGFRATDPSSEYVLLLNSDVAMIRPDLLFKLVQWMEGTIEVRPSVWGFEPTQPSPGPRDIVSAGFAHDINVLPGHMRPEGFCCLIRRSVWVDLSPDFPWHYGFEEAISTAVVRGAKCGVLSQYPPYLVHREGGSGKSSPVNKRTPDIPGWFRGLNIETLDFTLGPNEHDTYILW